MQKPVWNQKILCKKLEEFQGEKKSTDFSKSCIPFEAH
jgi:hypothetical protein